MPVPALPIAVQVVLDAAERLGEVVPHVVAVGLVGSYARGAGRPTSDVDLVVLTTDPAALLERPDWLAFFDPRAELIRAEDFGAIQERRLRLHDGLVVEVGIGMPPWAAVDPVDPGTRRVVSDGIVVVYDPSDLLDTLIRAMAS